MDSNQTIPALYQAAGPVTLTGEQIEDLARKLAKTRHDINGKLNLMTGYAELMAMKPEKAADYLAVIKGQLDPITDSMRQFSEALESSLGVTRGKGAA